LGSAWILASIALISFGVGAGDQLVYLGLGLLWLAGTAAVLYFLIQLELGQNRRAPAQRDLDRFRALVERSGEIVLVLGPRGHVEWASSNVRDVLGHPVDPNAVAQERLTDFIHADDRRKALRALADARRAGRDGITCELRVHHRDGSVRFFDAWGRDLLDDPDVHGILVTLRDITPRKRFESEIEQLAYYDGLTEVANRRFFFEHGAQSLAMAKRHAQSAAVVYLDLDRFKLVNDALGHEAGNALLRDVAHAVRHSIRETDVVARMGGDEFAVLLTDVRDSAAAGRAAGRIMANLPGTAQRNGNAVAVATSMGIAMYPDDGSDLESLLKCADLAMYRAKSDRSGMQFFRPELRGLMQQQMRLEADLRRAFEHHEFDLHYQPIHSLATGELVGAEALSRWRNLSRGIVQAADFIQLAEHAGLITSLDRWAVGAALHHRQQMEQSGWRGWVAVNLSPQTVRDPGFVAFVRSALENADLSPGSLVLEIGEAAAMRDADATADLLWELKSLGVAIALDDYGTGPSSLSQLKRFPVDILKLDAGFTSGIGTDSPDEEMVRGTIAIAHGIHAKVLAKGVEKDEQVEWLRDAGCEYVQGFLVGRPVPMAQLQTV
ncbi:MAG: EAL domain-containing protein, partial [Gemmatimonadota bacterium]